jgi:hypothetical protein
MDKDFKSGWFKRNANFIIDTFDNLLSDQSFTPTTVRLAILVMANLHQICKASSSSATKVYLKKKLTIEKLEYYFEGVMPDINEQLTQSEVDELSIALRQMLPSKDAESIIEKA